MGRAVKKKKKHWILRILVLLLLLILAAVILLGIRLVPTASRLQRALTARNCAVTLDVALDIQELTADQQKFLSILSRLTGLEETEWQELTLRGGYDGEAIRMDVYGRQGTLLTQLYLTSDCQAMNLHMVYDRAHSYLTEKAGLLARVLPDWNMGDYISLQQLEAAFGLELGELPDIQEGMERIQSGLSLPAMCGIILAADQWDREAQKLVYHITDSDSRLAYIRQIARKKGDSEWLKLLQLPEGMVLDVTIDLGGSQVRMGITGQLPETEQLADWSARLLWDGYTPAEGEISLMDQQVLNELSALLELLETILRQ
ncbi:MAG: hypothetical protein J6B43_11650 [Lachnospiraceae bacterium]|nr:hypothetical protein [Lachnospiraceae bacterium]